MARVGWCLPHPWRATSAVGWFGAAAAAAVMAAVAMGVPHGAAGASVFVASGKPGFMAASLDEAISDGSNYAGAKRILPTCMLTTASVGSRPQCCVTVCATTTKSARWMSWGTGVSFGGRSRSSNQPRWDAACPIAYGTFSISKTFDSSSFQGTLVSGSTYDMEELPVCASPGLQWATGISGGALQWSLVVPPKTSPRTGGSGSSGGTSNKQAAHSACVVGCRSKLKQVARAEPACIAEYQRKQLAFSGCVEDCDGTLQ